MFHLRKTKAEMTFCSDVMKGNARGCQMVDSIWMPMIRGGFHLLIPIWLLADRKIPDEDYGVSPTETCCPETGVLVMLYTLTNVQSYRLQQLYPCLKSAGLIRRSQVTGRRSQVTGRRSQVAGRGSQVTGHGSQVTGHGSQVTGHRSQVSVESK